MNNQQPVRPFALRFAAFAMAMQAIEAAKITPGAIESLERLAQSAPPDHALVPAVAEFQRVWQGNRRDPDLIYTAGQALLRAVERSNWPDAAAMDRVA